MNMVSNDEVGVAPSIKVGDVLNGIFQVKRFIARGGMGEVFEGVNVNTDEIVAIKVMLAAFAANPVVELMFRNEARILTKLSHPALVHYRVLAREPNVGLLYIVMDYIDGVPLSQVMDSIGATTTELIALTRRLADGLRSAHKLGAIHRDLSPDNVLLERGRLERARIVDFGIAKNLNPAHGLITIDGFTGKIGYAAPEQLGDYDGEVGPWTDVYGLGLMILSLALGRKAAPANTLEEAIATRRAPIDLSLVQPELRPILQAMLVADPAARMRSMDEVIEALDRGNFEKTLFAFPGASLTPTKSVTPGIGAPARFADVPKPAATKPSARKPARRWGTALAAGGALALLGAGGWWAYSQNVADVHGDTINAAKMAVASANCAWIDVAHAPDDEGEHVIMVKGAAQDPAQINSAISTAVGRVGGEAKVDVSHVGALDPAACALVDTVRKMRGPMPILMVAQPDYQLRLDGAPSMPGKLGARTEETLDIGRDDKPFSVFGVTPTGEVSLLLDRSNLADMVKAKKVELIGDGKIRFTHDIAEPGWLGMMVVTGQDAARAKEWTIPASNRTQSWYDQISSDAAKGGWQADMIWLETKRSST
jgi:eukaryotic-like serine/threonine-protein kinase